jgi:hypothetical protein
MNFKLTLIAALTVLISSASFAQDYVGDSACAGCHGAIYSPYMDSGHPWKIFHNEGEAPAADTWPHTEIPPLPVVEGEQFEWSDAEYVVGNYFWKTRFMDREGYLVTGNEDETTQWNVQTEEWVGYSAGTVDKPFNCGRCHTTGYDPEGDSQHGLAGIVGSWEQDGVRCEACHGPSGDHIGNPGSVSPPGGKACSECHYRDSEFRMPWSGGFMKHHQQSEDLAHSAHMDMGWMNCATCHNPHRSTVYNDGGMTNACVNCHAGNEDNGFYIVEDMEDVTCVECHMPKMGKSATTHGEYIGDVASHLFRISTDPVFAVDNTYEVDGNTYWNQDGEGSSVITLDYACMGCHIEIGEDINMAELADFAENIHTSHASAVEPNEVPQTIRIASVYPNPFNPTTTISFSTDLAYVVDIDVYDLAGNKVMDLYHNPTHAGNHEVEFNAETLSSGVYMIHLTGGNESVVEKVTLVK